VTMFGYARVSTRDQDFAGQVAELTSAGCAKVYREKASGAKSDRVELAKVAQMASFCKMALCSVARFAPIWAWQPTNIGPHCYCGPSDRSVSESAAARDWCASVPRVRV
jgi:hypothetical protein